MTVGGDQLETGFLVDAASSGEITLSPQDDFFIAFLSGETDAFFDQAFADTEAATASLLKDTDDPLAAFVDSYASIAHCENPASGCAIPMLGCDVARGDERLRAVYRGQIERYLALLEQQLGPRDDARQRAVVALSSLVGAVLVARAIDDKALAEEILHDVRTAVKSSNRHERIATPSARTQQDSRRR